MKHLNRKNRRSGFTITEVAVSGSICCLVMAGVLPLVVMTQQAWGRAQLQMATHRDASMAVERMVFGVEKQTGLRGCSSATITHNDPDWSVEFTNIDGDTMTFDYDAATRNIMFNPGNRIIAEDVVASTLERSGDTLTIMVAVEGTYRGKVGVSTSTTTVAFRNQW